MDHPWNGNILTVVSQLALASWWSRYSVDHLRLVQRTTSSHYLVPNIRPV